MPSLTREEALTRAALVTVSRMQVDLDLTRGPELFGSFTRIEFTAASGSATFVDLKATAIARIELNGVALDPASVEQGRLALSELQADNVLTVEATMTYARDGQGLHRSVDPADGRPYVYGHMFLDAAPRVFACFDQPDLKAPYAVSVTAPADWLVVANGVAAGEPAAVTGWQGEGEAPRRWEFASTPPLASYVVTVCAGPYAVVRAEHDGTPMAIYARASLADALAAQAGELFALTARGFDAYHELFGLRYPFGDYDQVFVPDFNAGAMENPGCVTIRDAYLFRGVASDADRQLRATTIVHELAHMWFGDLVTMRWWDDLWLNESFAEYLAYRTLVAITGDSSAWVEFSILRKLWGYAADRSPSTHPVAGSPAPDAISALGNFDGISYAKGAAVLRQLIAHIGDDAFVAGVRAYLREHAFGNGELADFLGALEVAADRSLRDWSAAWLETAGADTISTELGGWVVRRAPADHPADRPHHLDVAGWSGGEQRFAVSVVVTGERDCSQELAAAPPADFVVPNAGDLSWAEVELAADSVAAMARELPLVPDPLARAVAWSALLTGVARTRIDARTALDVFTAAGPAETDDTLFARVAAQLVERLIPAYLLPAARESAMSRMSGVGVRVLHADPPGAPRALAAARLVAQTSGDEDRLRSWLAGRMLPAGLEALAADHDFRWLLVRNLASRGLFTALEVEQWRRHDDSVAGRLACLQARAAIPDVAAKGWAWSELTANPALSNHEALALAAGFWVAPDPALVEPYVTRFPDAIVAMQGWLGDDALSRVVKAAFPGSIVTHQTAAMATEMLERDDLTPGVRRAVVDAAHLLSEALAGRSHFG